MTFIKQTLIATFDQKEPAERALCALHEAGFGEDQLSVLTRDPRKLQEIEAHVKTEDLTAKGGKVGGIFGGAFGAALGLFAFLIPGPGPILAAGPIIMLLTGTAIGAATGGLVGALAVMGVPHTEAEIIADSVKDGSILITVNDHPERILEARQLLLREEPEEVQQRATVWSDSAEQKSPFTDEELEAERALQAHAHDQRRPRISIYEMPSPSGAAAL